MSFGSISHFGHIRGDEHLPGYLQASGNELLRADFRQHILDLKLSRWSEETQHEIDRDNDVERVIYGGEAYKKVLSWTELANLSLGILSPDELMDTATDSITDAFESVKRQRIGGLFHIAYNGHKISDEEFVVELHLLDSNDEGQQEAA
jgi:hypothetical protein